MKRVLLMVALVCAPGLAAPARLPPLTVWPPDAQVARETDQGLQPLGPADEAMSLSTSDPVTLVFSAPGYASQRVTVYPPEVPPPIRLAATAWWVDGWTEVRLHPLWLVAGLGGLGMLGWRGRRRQPVLETPSEPTDKRLGTCIGRYRLTRAVGAGGMGMVYEAVTDDGTRVAVKLMQRDPVEPGLEAIRFRREISITRDFDHPGLVRVLDFGDQDGDPYLVMELLTGETLRSLCQKGPLSFGKFRQVFVAILEAVAYAHTHGVLHRDLKTSNIFMTTDGRPIVLDFGVSKGGAHTRITRTGAVVGTPHYMAPEQADGVVPTEKSDQYSLGVVAYEMLTGQLPFQAEFTLQMVARKLFEPAPPIHTARPDVPADIALVVDRMLSREPEDRFESLQAILDTLQS